MSDVAIATLVLAFFTMLAVVVPVITSALDRRAQRIGALLQLDLIVSFFETRVRAIATRPQSDAEALMLGLDVALGRALLDDVGRSVPGDALTATLLALFEAHEALSYFASYRRNHAGHLFGEARVAARSRFEGALVSLLNAHDELGYAACRCGITNLSEHTLHAIPDDAPDAHEFTKVLDD